MTSQYYSSDEEDSYEEDGCYRKCFIPASVHDSVDRNKIIYHIDPKGVIQQNPELEGKVFQSYLLCTMCNQYKKMTPTNSFCIPLNEKSVYKQYYIFQNANCMEKECVERYKSTLK